MPINDQALYFAGIAPGTVNQFDKMAYDAILDKLDTIQKQLERLEVKLSKLPEDGT